MESVLQLLDDIESYLQECNNLPFSNKVVVNMAVLYEFMNDLRMRLPEEIKRSQRIIEDKDSMLEKARIMADKMAKDAESEAQRLLAEHVIRKKAMEEAENIIARANAQAEEITDGAYNYVDELLKISNQALQDTMQGMGNQFQQFDTYMKKQVDTIEVTRKRIQKPTKNN